MTHVGKALNERRSRGSTQVETGAWDGLYMYLQGQGSAKVKYIRDSKFYRSLNIRIYVTYAR